jgi:hypothetical protein
MCFAVRASGQFLGESQAHKKAPAKAGAFSDSVFLPEGLRLIQEQAPLSKLLALRRERGM